jgi:hypothetical protein
VTAGLVSEEYENDWKLHSSISFAQTASTSAQLLAGAHNLLKNQMCLSSTSCTSLLLLPCLSPIQVIRSG